MWSSKMEPPSAHVTPTEEMINLFDSWDTTKLKNRLRSFNRAKSWFCKVLKCPFPELPEKHNLRQKDNENALELLLEAYSSGLPFEDYIKRGLQGTIIVKTESESNAASSDDEGNDSKDDSFCDAPEIITEETRVAVATKHCEPDCSQCRVAAETITFTRVASATGGAAVTGETVAAEVPKRPPVCHFL